MSHNAEMILDQIDVVKLDINLWTSSKKLKPEDLVLADGSKLPPEELAYLGTKKTVDPEKLKEFNRIKKEAERICLQSGTRFIGGFANPRGQIPRITHELDELSKLFYQAKAQFLASYHQDTEDWIARHKEFGDAIRRAIEPVDSVAEKLRFDYVVFRVTAPQADETETAPIATQAVDSLIRRTTSMSEQLFHEIAQEANQLIDRSFVGKDTVTGRTLNAFRRMRDKLDSLGFLDHRCMPVVDKIDTVLVALPKSGPYNGVAFNSLFSLGLLLSDPDKIKRHGSGLLQMENISIANDDENGVFDPDDADTTTVKANSDQNDLDISQLEVVEPVADSEQAFNDPADDDDLPGFDDFLASRQAPNVPAASAAVTALVETVIESVKSQAPAAVQVENTTDSNAQDSSEIIESNSTEEAIADFWF